MKWFTPWWWQYLFSRQTNGKRPAWRMVVCRARGHDDVWWFNSAGLEPDMHCKWCGEDLG